MKTHYTVALAMLAGFGLGAVAVQGLHAQAKPPVYAVTEIDVANTEGWSKDYAPKAQALIKSMGGRVLAVGSGPKVTTVEGAPVKSRVAIQVWDSMEKFQAYRNSADFKDLRKMAEKFDAKFRSFTVEGLPQ